MANVVVKGEANGVIGIHCNDNGRFEITNAYPDELVFTAELAGFLASEPVPIKLGNGERREGIVLRLRAGSSLAGIVVDDRGEPVSGALVQPALENDLRWAEGAAMDSRNRLHRLELPAPVLTDERGAFVVKGLPHGQRFVLCVSKEGMHQDAEYGKELHESPASGLIVRLHRDGALSGRAVDIDGRPIAGATIRISKLDAPPRIGMQSHSRWNRAIYQVAITAEDGQFKFVWLRAGKHVLESASTTHVEPPRMEIAIKEGDELAGIEIVFGRAAAVTGRVVFDDGEPVVNVQVEIENFAADPGRRPKTRTDQKGRFAITDAMPGVYYSLSVSTADSYGGGRFDEGRRSVIVGTPIEMVIRRAGVVTFGVQDESGARVLEVEVHTIQLIGGVESEDNHGRFHFRERLDRYFLTGVDRELNALVVDAEGYRATRVPAAFPQGNFHVDLGVITLSHQGAALEGVVFGPDGAPISGAIVSVAVEFDSAKAITDDEGRYALWPLAQGEARVSARHREHPMTYSRIAIADESASYVCNLQFAAGGVLTGSVKDTSGETRGGLWIYAISINDKEMSGYAHVDQGEFQVELAPGRYLVEVRNRHQDVLGTPQEVQIEVARETRVDFIVEP